MESLISSHGCSTRHPPQALGEMGISKRKTAVPSSEASTAAAFSAPPLSAASLQPVLHPAPDAVQPPVALLQRARTAWPRGDGYFFRCLALQQRLQEACRAPSKDLSAAEAQACSNLTAHLIYLQRQARATLQEGCAALEAVHRVVAACAPSAEHMEQHAQEMVDAWWTCLQQHVPLVEQALRWGALILQEASVPLVHTGMGVGAHHTRCCGLLAVSRANQHLHVSPGNSEEAATLTDAAAVLTAALARLRAAALALSSLAASIPVVDDAPLTTPATCAAMSDVTTVLINLHDTLSVHASSSLPGWCSVLGVLADAHTALQPLYAVYMDKGRPPQLTSNPLAGDAVAHCVQQVQLWVQGVCRGTREGGPAIGEHDGHHLPPVLSALQRGACRMGALRASTAASAALQVLQAGIPSQEGLRGLLCMLATACHVVCLEHVVLYKALAKLGYVVASVLVGVLLEGFCTPEGDNAADDGMLCGFGVASEDAFSSMEGNL